MPHFRQRAFSNGWPLKLSLRPNARRIVAPNALSFNVIHRRGVIRLKLPFGDRRLATQS